MEKEEGVWRRGRLGFRPRAARTRAKQGSYNHFCGMECCQGRFCTKKSVALSRSFVSLFFLAAAFQGHPIGLGHRPGVHPQDPRGREQREAVHVRAAGRQDEVTKRFDSDKVVNVVDVTVHAVLDDGSHGTVVALLSEVLHRNIARAVGFCPNSSNPVHEHFAGGTLEEHLRQVKGRVFSWYHRVNIAIELASALTYLQAHETAPTFLHNLKSGEIFLDDNFTAKIAGYKLARPVAPKLREGRLHEVIIDPTLLTGKQLPAPNEEVRKMFELTVMYMLSAQNGLCMLGVAKELMQIVRNNIGSSSKIEISLEETFLELEPAADDVHVAQDAASPSSLKRELAAELHHHLIHLE
uniref:Serine-threonine/tyrosine-protein kinase catalytic domain-containing protein n=1 Tax=Oryza meridionalis TaxID=40149 RepID=A0A0E0DHL9_9ORYZ